MILLVHADTTTNERRAVEHVYTHVWGLHMFVVYTIAAVQMCSVPSVVVLVFDLAWVSLS